MRIITFQPLKVLYDTLAGGTYYMEASDNHRMKTMDIQYCDEHHMPIYGFASLNGKPICLSSVVEGMGIICSVGDLTSRMMYELEVPEEEILSMKSCLLFEENIPEVFNRDYGIILHNDFFKGSTTSYEVLLPYLKSGWIVCVRSPHACYIPTKGRRNPGILWTTAVFNERLNPLWRRNVIFFNSSYMANVKTLQVVTDIDEYLSSRCCPDLLVTQALYGVLNESAYQHFCVEYLGVSDYAKIDNILQNSNKIYMKDYGYEGGVL